MRLYYCDFCHSQTGQYINFIIMRERGLIQVNDDKPEKDKILHPKESQTNFELCNLCFYKIKSKFLQQVEDKNNKIQYRSDK